MTSHKPLASLSKKNQIYGRYGQYLSYHDAIINTIKASMNIFQHASPDDGFKAMMEISSDLETGDAVGIMELNNDGKSMLVKIPSLITAPIARLIEMNGRVGTMLKVRNGYL